MSTPIVDPALESAISELSEDQRDRIRAVFAAQATAKGAERDRALADLRKTDDAERVQAVRDAVNEALRERDRQWEQRLAGEPVDRDRGHAARIAMLTTAHELQLSDKDDMINNYRQRVDQLLSVNAEQAARLRNYEGWEQLIGVGVKSALGIAAVSAITKRLR